MTKSYHCIIAVTLAMLMVGGSAGTAMAALQVCAPNACCCMKGHSSAGLPSCPMDTASGCAGNAPCCQVEPMHQAKEVAAVIARPELPEANELTPAIVHAPINTTRQTPFLARPYHHNGKPPAPLVPIYIETQMLLC